MENLNIKQYILDQLVLNINTWVSGGDLAKTLNVSRNTIWRSINKMKKEGYQIESVTGRGYLLAEDKDKLKADEIKFNLKNSHNYKIEVLDTVDSTNKILKEKARQGAESGTVLVANFQKSGRGRLGRDFFSPPGSGVYFSLLIKPNPDLNPGQKSPALAAVALSKTIDYLFKEESKIKWVNDLYLKEKKVAGILSEGEIDFETQSIKYIVIGVGINVYQPHNGFPKEIADRAGAIYHETKPKFGLRNKIVAEFLNQWEFFSQDKNIAYALKEFRSKNFLKNQLVEIKYKKEYILAEVLDINDEFELIVKKDNDQLLTINQGEATLHKE